MSSIHKQTWSVPCVCVCVSDPSADSVLQPGCKSKKQTDWDKEIFHRFFQRRFTTRLPEWKTSLMGRGRKMWAQLIKVHRNTQVQDCVSAARWTTYSTSNYVCFNRKPESTRKVCGSPKNTSCNFETMLTIHKDSANASNSMKQRIHPEHFQNKTFHLSKASKRGWSKI